MPFSPARSATPPPTKRSARGRLTFTAGVDNVFDVYPDKNNQGDATTAGNNNFGIFPYNQISPFGFNGAFYYGRLTFGF
jgi:iron complex outermembrane recepter protein